MHTTLRGAHDTHALVSTCYRTLSLVLEDTPVGYYAHPDGTRVANGYVPVPRTFVIHGKAIKDIAARLDVRIDPDLIVEKLEASYPSEKILLL